jgi:hypothetical protein
MGGNVTTIQHSLNAGEVSPRMEARQDQNKYLASCERLENFLPVTLGGIYRRPGTRFVAEAKEVEGHPLKRLIPFTFSSEQAYVLEFGHEYIRFFKDGEPVMTASSPIEELEVVTPYADTDLANLFYFQSADVMYICHPSFAVHKLSRTDNDPDTFVLTEVHFDPPATIADQPTGADLGAGTLTPAATTGSGINVTAASAVWLGSGTSSGDVGRLIVSGGARAIITSITSSTVAVVDIIDDFASTSPIADTDWRLVGSPKAQLTPDTSIDAGQPNFMSADVDSFRTSDVGKWIAVAGGFVLITFVNSPTSINTLVKTKLRDAEDPPAATRAWTLEVTGWSDTLGWPSCGCFFQDRMYLGRGQTIFGSITGDYENFAKGSNGDDGIVRTISDDQVNPIVWMKGLRTLQVGTGNAAYECVSSSDHSLTPTDFNIHPIAVRGAARIAPIRVGGTLIYVQSGQRKIRELVFDFATDKFKSPSLLILAEHLTERNFITDLVYQQEPDSIIHAIRDDGILLSLVYQEDENVIGWSRHVTEGEFKSLTVIPRPSTGKDWLWVIVERENGTYIEYFEPNAAVEDTGREWGDLQTDCASLTVHDPETFVINGLGRFEGLTVRVLGDGMLFDDAVVESGQITLSPQVPVSRVEVGLDYVSVCRTLEPQLPAGVGGPFIARGYAEIGVRIRRTLGLKIRAYRVGIEDPTDEGLTSSNILLSNDPADGTIQGTQLTFRKPYHVMDRQVPLQRGKVCIANLGYDPFARIEVKQDLPFPAEILNIVGVLHVGDRWDCGTYDDVPADVVIPISIYGFVQKLCGEPCPFQFAEAAFDGSQVTFEGGLAAGGPAIRVSALATRSNFTGLAAIYVPDQSTLAMVRYDGEPLSDIAADVIEAIPTTLEVGDVIRIEAVSSDDPTSYQIKVNGSVVIGPNTVSGDDLSLDNGCVAFIALGDVTEDLIP